MRAEELPHRQSYQRRFRDSVNSLIAAGRTRTDGLTNIDVIGAYLGASVAIARKTMPGYDIAGLLRTVADDIEQKEKS